MVGLAFLAIVIGAVYQDDNRLDEPNIVGAGTTSTVAGAAAPADSAPVATAIIEGFLPKSGEASACREAVGVDLAPNYGAILTINGVEVAPEEMNVNLTPEGEISGVVTASRSLGQYTFQPDENCPNGRWLRPVDNSLEVCVYLLSDASQRCTLRETRLFDAL